MIADNNTKRNIGTSMSNKPPLKKLLQNTLIQVVTTVLTISTIVYLVTCIFKVLLGTSGYVWQELWDSFLDVVGDNSYTLWVYGSLMYSTCLYWIICAVYTFMDITNKPKMLRKYKIQPGTNEPLDTSKITKVILTVLFNQLIIGFPLAILNYYAIKRRGYPPIRELPSFPKVLSDFAVFVIVQDIGFYYTHRILHHKFFFKYIHRIHHEWTSPISMLALYCHPIEHILSNIMPLQLGPYIMGSHIATSWLWMYVATNTTINIHSGYCFPFLPAQEPHDYHHMKFNECYGGNGLLDGLYGTDTNYRKYRPHEPYTIFWGFSPIRRLNAHRTISKTK